MPICPQTAICFNALIRLHSSHQLSAKTTLSLFRLGLANFFPSSDDKAHETPVRVIAETLNILQPIARESFLSTNPFFRREPWSIEKSSPLLLHSTYSAAVAFLQLDRGLRLVNVKDRGDFDLAFPIVDRDELKHEAAQGLQTMKLKLALLANQWSAADEYLRILEAREIGDMA